MIEIEGLNVSFGHGAAEKPVLHDVSLRVETGERFGLVGESGSGKSTILRTVMGLVPGYRGRIAVDGRPVRGQRSKRDFRRIQMIFQDPYGTLHPRHTVDWTLNEPLLIQNLRDRDRRIRDVLVAVGLSDALRFRFPHQLSGGQRQRVAIARAIVLNPEILLLDEPTSALDVSIQAEVLNLMDDLHRQFGLTYLFVSHDLAVVAHMCDRIAVMRDGAILEVVTADQLRSGQVAHPYTGELIRASLPYRRRTGGAG